jgi:hypothetical protein
MLNIIRKKVEDHPFKDVDDLHKFIDDLLDQFFKPKGRNEDTIRQGKATRASV